MNRREFLQSTAATAVAAGVARGISVEAQGAAGHAAAEAWPENGTLIPDEGWRLWVDRAAEWKQDAIFLPEDVAQGPDGVVMGAGKALPVNAPTGGWGVLTSAAAGSIPAGPYGRSGIGQMRAHLNLLDVHHASMAVGTAAAPFDTGGSIDPLVDTLHRAVVAPGAVELAARSRLRPGLRVRTSGAVRVPARAWQPGGRSGRA